MKLPTQDRRTCKRFPTANAVQILTVLYPVVDNALLRNISYSGVQIQTKRCLIDDDEVSLFFKCEDEENSLILKGKIVWSKSNKSELWDVGIHFTDAPIKDVEELFHMLQIS